jgi:Domain of unknown function (DUF4602)
MTLHDNKKSASTRAQRQPVVVVAAPSGFPISNKRTPSTIREPRKQSTNNDNNNRQNDIKLLDWKETTREVHKLGTTGLASDKQRSFKDEEYFRLTGRYPKKQKMALPMVRSLRKKRAAQEAKERAQAREMGVILPKETKATTSSSKQKKNEALFGPAPSIGRVKGGMLKVKQDQKRRR